MTTIIEKPETLQEARRVLRSFGLTEVELPRTLSKSLDKIAELSGAKFPQPRKADSGTLARAREFLGAPDATQTDPQNMSAAQLEIAIGREKDIRRRKDLFITLQERQAGTPRRSVLERTRGLTDAELEKRIEATKDPVERGELFSILSGRARK